MARNRLMVIAGRSGLQAMYMSIVHRRNARRIAPSALAKLLKLTQLLARGRSLAPAAEAHHSGMHLLAPKVIELFANIGYAGQFGVMTGALSFAGFFACIVVRLIGETGLVILELYK